MCPTPTRVNDEQIKRKNTLKVSRLPLRRYANHKNKKVNIYAGLW